MAVLVEEGRLTLTGYVGESTLEIDGWTIFDGFTHAEVVAALGEIGPDADLVVHLNSGGGIATEGTAIRSALTDREGRTDVVIDGIAASAASIIAMGGETVSMALGALLMIHDPSGFTWGTVADHDKTIRALNSLGDTYARVYARKSGKPDAECRDIMRAETWYTPEEAVTAGFADVALEETSQAVAAFPYQTYAHAPRDLVAQAQSNGWRPPLSVTRHTQPARPKASATPKPKERPPMAETPKASTETPPTPEPPATPVASTPAAPQDERGRIKAIMEAEAAQTQPALARHLAFDTDMTAEAAIAALSAASADAPTASTAPAPDSAGYQARRSAAADLAQPAPTAQAKPKATINTGSIYAARRFGKEA
ncbi:head maturation protease, ClpP-related [Palleronia caenipelagi]|uniref:ATP-dependent Clp protease proteolytic subunit n=1 Tax=Palleronia caenipelagi TaxID=2489174 RepID=A0A547PS29_9RHOB|nr:head maturation protease, ClpP-related [Palleronia caenipelagi]TRD16957.1 Clp protease ClpP [Palleronia caenipelagi]